MTRLVAKPNLALAWLLAGLFAALLSALVLGALSAMRGLPVWIAMNATTHAFYGPDTTTAFDLDHTGLGSAIHVTGAFFWALVAVFTFRRVSQDSAGLAWTVGLGTAAIAGAVDYLLMPARLTPGWDLVLPPLGVVAGLLALGVGFSLGLIAALAIAARSAQTRGEGAGQLPASPPPQPEPPLSALSALRHPAPHVLDQRQQRIDPAGMVTADPNRNSADLPAPDHNEKPMR